MQFPVHLQVQVQCVMCSVQCAGWNLLPAKDENLAVEIGKVKKILSLKNTSQTSIALMYFLGPVETIGNQSIGPLGRCYL